MKNTGGSNRSRSARDKGSSKSAQTQIQNTNTLKSEGPPMKTMQPTAEQLALNHLIHSKDAPEDADLQSKIKQIMDLTGFSQDKVEIALYDSKNDMDKAVNELLEGGTDENEWRESGKKKKKQKPSEAPPPENHADSKPDRRDHKERNDRDNRDRNKEEKENGEKGYRETSDSFRQRPRRNDNRPPRLSRGRGRPDRAGDRPERDDDGEKDDNKDRGFDRGRGRGRGFGPRRGRGGGPFRPNRSGFETKSSPNFENGPQIDTWTNETAVIGEKEPKISKWGDSNEDWNEDIDSWTGSLAETKVFTASATAAPEPANPNPVQIETNTLTNTFDLGVLYPKHPQNDMSAEASYISQFNQQATESIKNSIGIGSGQNSSLQNSMTSQTASNVSALVSLTQNALQDNLGSSLTELTGNSLTGSALAGNGLVGTSLGSSLSTSLPVNSLTGSALHSTSLSGNDLTRNSLTSLSGTSLAGNSLTGTNVTGSGLTSLTGNTLSAGTQSVAGPSSVIPASTVSQNAMLQQRQKPQRSKLPPPSKIPASAVEMPGNIMTTLDVQFGGNLEFGDSPAFSFGGNESVTSAFTSADSNSTPTINDHVGATVGQVQVSNLSKTSEALISTGLEQNSPRSSSLYQQSPYTTPTKQNPADSNTINTPPEPLQLQGTTSDLKSNQLMSGQAQPVSLPSTKIDSNLGSYSSGSSYQSAGYQSQKSSSGYQSSSKPGSYSGTQYQSQSAPSQNQSNSSQFSSQYRQSSQNQYQSGSSQFPTGSQYQSPPSGYQSSPAGYQSSQSGYQSNQQQYQSGQSQFQNYQSGSTFQNQTNYSSNQPNSSVLYPNTTSTSFSSQSQQNSLYSQNSRPSSYSNQSYLNEHASGAGSSFQTSVTQSNSAFKENQSGASSFRDNVPSSSKTRDSQSDSSTYNRDTQSASSFSDSQSMAYNRDSQSVGNSYNRDPSNSFKRDSKSASGSYPRDTPSTDSGAYSRDSQSASSASYTGRDSQSSTTGFRDTQTGSSGYAGQAGSYPRDASQSQSQAGYSAKNYRNSTEVTSLASSFTGSKLVDNFSKMAVKDGPLDTIQSSNSQFDSVSSTSKVTTNTTSLTSSTTSSTISSTGTTVISSTTTKISTLPSASSTSSKAPPNLPPGVPLMAQQYIMGQGTLPFYGLQGLQGLQQPLYANLEDIQYLQQRMPPLATSNMYDLQATAAAAGIPLPPTSMNSSQHSTQQTIPTVPYSGSNDSSKLPRVDAQSPTGSVPANSQPSGTGQSAAHQQPYIHLNYSYYYPPSLIPGAGFQYPMIPMPQVTNAAHAGTPANAQYQQKNYGSHVQYGTNKMYDDLTAQTGGDFKSPYGTSQTQPKANISSSGTGGSGSSDIQIPGYGGKTHAQAFDKQGFHAGTPPPFNLQMAAGQLATGNQAGPLGAPTAAYGAPFVPMMTHQPHSQMLHHQLQDTASSSRGSQQTVSHTQSKTASKSYTGSNWGSY